MSLNLAHALLLAMIAVISIYIVLRLDGRKKKVLATIVFSIITLIVHVLVERVLNNALDHAGLMVANSAPSSTLRLEATPYPTPTWTPIPLATVTPISTSTPMPTSTPESTPTPTPDLERIRIRNILDTLFSDSIQMSYYLDRDAGLKRVVDESVHYGQFDIAFKAAKAGEYFINQSNMMAKVALCMAKEGWSDRIWFDYARQAATHIEYYVTKESIQKQISDLDHSSLRDPAPGLYRRLDWLRAPF